MERGSSSNGGNDGTGQGVYYLFGKPIPLHEFVPLPLQHNEQPAPPARTERGETAFQVGTGLTTRGNFYVGESSMQGAGTNMEMSSNPNLISSGNLTANDSASVEAQDASMDAVLPGVVERARGREDMNSNIDLNNPATDEDEEENGEITSGVIANEENGEITNGVVTNEENGEITSSVVANNAYENGTVANGAVESAPVANDTVENVVAANAVAQNEGVENGAILENGAVESNSDSGASAHTESETGSADVEGDAAME